ncbi:MAG: hypothetical protein WC972_02330 [Trueperaceae bacterium]
MIVGSVIKQPGERFPFRVSFAQYMAETEDTLVGVTAAADDPGLVVHPVTLTGEVAVVWMDKDTPAGSYKVTVIVTSAGGQILEAEVRVRVRDF